MPKPKKPKKRGQGMLRLWADEIEARLLPAFVSHGLLRNSAMRSHEGWNDQAYQWFFYYPIKGTAVALITLTAGYSRDPVLHVDAALYRLYAPDEAIEAALIRIEKDCRDPAYTVTRHPGFIHALRLIGVALVPNVALFRLPFLLLQLLLVLHANRLIRLGLAIFLWPVLLVSSVLFLPWTIGHALWTVRWLKSAGAVSGKRQKRTVTQVLRKLPHFPRRLTRAAGADRP